MSSNLKKVLSIFLVGVVLGGSVFLSSLWLKYASAVDGSGTNTVNPTTTTASSAGNEFDFTYTASETMDSGGISITVPAGWSAPHANIGVPGYTTANSSGIIANQKNSLDSSSGWAVTNHMSLSSDTADKQAGIASLSNDITLSAVANEQWYFNYGSAADWGSSVSGNLRVGAFLKSSVSTSAGNLHWQNDDSANLVSPNDTISLPALTANTWTYASATLGAASRNSILSYGFRYSTDIGATVVKADNISVIFQSNDSNAGWSGDTGINDSLITGIEGTGAVRCTYAGNAGTGANGDCFNQEAAVATVGPGTTVSFFVRPSIALNAGDFAWTDDNSSNVGSPDSVVSLPALPANVWTYVTVTSSSSENMRSFGLRQLVDRGALTIDIDAIGKVVDTCDSTSGWTAPTSTVQTLATDNSIFHEGTGSLRNTIASTAAAGDKWYESFGAENWSGYTNVGFWIRSSVAVSSGQLKFEYASSSDLASPITSINIGALSANVWSYQKLTLTGTRNSVMSYGINYATDIGSATIYLDDVLLGPGSVYFSGNDINVRLLSLSSGQTVGVNYGDGGGASGVTAPSTPGVYTFNTRSRSDDSGILADISVSPTITVRQTTTTDLETSGSPSIYGSPITFTATVTPTTGGAPSGTVTFRDGLTIIGTDDLNGANPGVAALTVNNLTVSGSPHSITATYGGNAIYFSSVSGVVSQTVTPKNLTVIGITANDKAYDGNTSAVLNVTGAALVGVVSGDNVILNTANAVGTFDTPAVGTGKTVTISGLMISGADAGNYTLTQPTTTASIVASGLTISGVTADDKIYDGTTSATLDVSGATLVGVAPGDDVVLETANAVGTFSDKNVGSGKTVTTSGFSISGADASGYTLNQPTTTASITEKELTVSGITASDKIYDGTTAATLNVSGAALVGLIPPDVVFLDTSAAVGTFDTPDIGTNKTVTIAGLSINGADAGNYSLTQPTTTASITAAPIVATRIVILQPSDAEVGSPITVTLRAEDNSGNLAASFNNVVTLLATGSATGAGPVNIVNGLGSVVLNNSVAETVTLSLIDSAGTGLDVSSTITVSWTSTPPEPTPGSSFISAPPTPKFIGIAFPNAEIFVSSFDSQGVFESSRTVSSAEGYFNIFLKTGGNTTYSLSATDRNKDVSITKVFSLDLDIGGLDTDLEVVIPPTIRLSQNAVRRGDNLNVSGYAFPNAGVRAFVDGVEKGGVVYPDNSGKYSISVNTADIDFGSHSVAVNETFNDGKVSENSIARSFTVSRVFTPQADFNADGKVDIQDWSVFLSRWNPSGEPDLRVDLNGDGKVDIADFSIILRAIQR
ncbi:MAG TPA: YDG domain-containing protein [Candidatus Colwellbacteria bacterium]|nr:YDG domain-containing protein [Candidatus Colwellbacteria bacterium]